MTEGPIKILLVEDNPGDARLLREKLVGERGAAFQLDVVERLCDALARIPAGGIDLLLLDLSLPDSRGLETFTAVRNSAPYLPVIVLSGLDDEELAVKAVREGAQDYLVKGTVENGLLIRSIRYALERSRADQALAREHNLLRTLVDNLPVSIFVKDAEGKVILSNPAYQQQQAMSSGADEAAADREMDTAVMRSGRPLIGKEEPLPGASGGQRWLLTTRVPLSDGFGRNIGLVGISYDITNRKLTEQELHLSMERLRRAIEGAIQAMALTVEIRDPYTAGHQRRVARLACLIAEELHLSGEEVEGLRLAASIHDLGKVAIPAEILSKPGSITETEFNIVKAHPRVGYEILKNIDFPWPIADIVLEHHQRIDGSGYPDLGHREMLMESRILAVADVVEAMSSYRPYRPALGIAKALAEIESHSGTLYDPAVVRACLKIFAERGSVFVLGGCRDEHGCHQDSPGRGQ